MNESALPVLKEALPVPQSTNSRLPAILFGVWACGFVAITFRWLQRWIRVRADMLAARPLAIEIGIPVVSSPVLREPGVFGVFRPVLLLPEGMAEELSKAEWEAILAHELCHARCYDNLTAAIYMLVETLFWFHPLVWWMGKRLVVEREFACDEEVLRLGSEPKVYAEGILKVCELYLESPLECVAGVTGSNLRRRLRAIMTHRGTERMNMGKKLVLMAAGVAILALPIIVGVMNAPVILAQSQPPLKFEVASIKPNNSGDARTSMMPYPEGRLTVENNSLKQLVRSAFGVKDFQLTGGPKWFDADRYDIVAKAEGPATREQLMRMLQSLLVERFKLSFHRETKQMPVFNLVVAKRGQLGPNLATHIAGTGTPRSFPIHGPPGHMDGSDATMPQLAASLSGTTGDRLVLDRTGLTGSYDFTLVWTPEQLPLPPGVPPEVLENLPNRPSADGPSLSTALQEQLGLKLESGRGPVEIIVIDGAERPSEN